MQSLKYSDAYGDGYIKAVAVNMCGGPQGLVLSKWKSSVPTSVLGQNPAA